MGRLSKICWWQACSSSNKSQRALWQGQHKPLSNNSLYSRQINRLLLKWKWHKPPWWIKYGNWDNSRERNNRTQKMQNHLTGRLWSWVWTARRAEDNKQRLSSWILNSNRTWAKLSKTNKINSSVYSLIRKQQLMVKQLLSPQTKHNNSITRGNPTNQATNLNNNRLRNPWCRRQWDPASCKIK